MNEEELQRRLESGEKAFSELPIKVKALDDGEIEIIAATNHLDRHGEVLDMDGIDLKAFMKNPVFLWAHNQRELPLGKVVSLKKRMQEDGKKALIARVKFATELYDKAKVVYEMYKEGFMNAASISFIPRDYVMDDKTGAITWTKSEMVELSSVPVPANSNALLLAKSAGLNVEAIDDFEAADKTDPTSRLLEVESELKELVELAKTSVSALGAMAPSATDAHEKGDVSPAKRYLIRLKKSAQVSDKSIELLIQGINSKLEKYQ